MSPGRVKPENCHGSSSLGSRNSKLYPVLDRSILGFAHCPDIPPPHCVREYLSPCAAGHHHCASTSHLKSLVTAAILLLCWPLVQHPHKHFTFVGVDHGQLGSGVVAMKNVSFNLHSNVKIYNPNNLKPYLSLLGMSLNLIINVPKSVVDIYS